MRGVDVTRRLPAETPQSGWRRCENTESVANLSAFKLVRDGFGELRRHSARCFNGHLRHDHLYPGDLAFRLSHRLWLSEIGFHRVQVGSIVLLPTDAADSCWWTRANDGCMLPQSKRADFGRGHYDGTQLFHYCHIKGSPT